MASFSNFRVCAICGLPPAWFPIHHVTNHHVTAQEMASFRNSSGRPSPCPSPIRWERESKAPFEELTGSLPNALAFLPLPSDGRGLGCTAVEAGILCECFVCTK